MVMVPVMSASPEHTMTKPKGKTGLIDVKGLLQRDEDFLRAALQALTQAALEAEMTETIGAAKGERTETRLPDRSGDYSRSLITRLGTLELRVPQDRDTRFSTELFQGYQRSERALVGALAEMYVQGCRRGKSRRWQRCHVATPSRPRRSAPLTSRCIKP
jgi:putative transposase